MRRDQVKIETELENREGWSERSKKKRHVQDGREEKLVDGEVE